MLLLCKLFNSLHSTTTTAATFEKPCSQNEVIVIFSLTFQSVRKNEKGYGNMTQEGDTFVEVSCLCTEAVLE